MEMNIQDIIGNYPRDQLMYCREAEIVPRRLKWHFLMLIDEGVGEAPVVPPAPAAAAVVEAASPEVGVD